MKLLDVLQTAEWGMDNFGSVTTSTAYPKRDVMRAVEKGFMASIGMVSIVDGDGFSYCPERIREGFILTKEGMDYLKVEGGARMSEALSKLNLERGLVIRQPHIGKILDGLKCWEMRSTKTSVRGRIGLIEAGSGLVVGEAEIVRVQQAPKRFRARYTTRLYHGIPEDEFSVMDKWCWAWVLNNVLRYESPVPYKHPQGAVIWVRFTKKGAPNE